VGAKLEFPAWSEAVFASITSLSRTAKGHTEAAYGGTKAALPITDPALLRTQVESNLHNAISKVWHTGAFIRLNPEPLTLFIEQIADTVSAGLIEPRHRYRLHDTRARFPQQVAPQHVQTELRAFVRELWTEIVTPPKATQAVRVAAWAEREFDWRIHPLRDACGRNAKLLGAWVLMRHQIPPAQFTNVDEYYARMNEGLEPWVEYYRSRIKPLPRAAA
jgi:hypothetical protein